MAHKKMHPVVEGMFILSMEVFASEIYHDTMYVVVPLSSEIPLSRLGDLSMMTKGSRRKLVGTAFDEARAWCLEHNYRIVYKDFQIQNGRIYFKITQHPPQAE